MASSVYLRNLDCGLSSYGLMVGEGGGCCMAVAGLREADPDLLGEAIGKDLGLWAAGDLRRGDSSPASFTKCTLERWWR